MRNYARYWIAKLEMSQGGVHVFDEWRVGRHRDELDSDVADAVESLENAGFDVNVVQWGAWYWKFDTSILKLAALSQIIFSGPIPTGPNSAGWTNQSPRSTWSHGH